MCRNSECKSFLRAPGETLSSGIARELGLNTWLLYKTCRSFSLLNWLLTIIRKFFPQDPAAVKDADKKEGEEPSTTSDKPKEPAALESALPAVPKAKPSHEKFLPKESSAASPAAQEPDTKKQKSTHENAEDSGDDWEKIDKASVPRHATVEDAEDEEPKKI